MVSGGCEYPKGTCPSPGLLQALSFTWVSAFLFDHLCPAASHPGVMLAEEFGFDGLERQELVY